MDCCDSPSMPVPAKDLRQTRTVRHMALAALIISIVAGVAALVAVTVSWWQLHKARVANQLPAVVDLFGEYRSPGLTTERRIVFEQIGPAEQRLPLSQLPDHVKSAAVQVCHYLDNLGVLVAEGLVQPQIVAASSELPPLHFGSTCFPVSNSSANSVKTTISGILRAWQPKWYMSAQGKHFAVLHDGQMSRRRSEPQLPVFSWLGQVSRLPRSTQTVDLCGSASVAGACRSIRRFAVSPRWTTA